MRKSKVKVEEGKGGTKKVLKYNCFMIAMIKFKDISTCCYDFNSDECTACLEHALYGLCTMVVLDPLPQHQVHLCTLYTVQCTGCHRKIASKRKSLTNLKIK